MPKLDSTYHICWNSKFAPHNGVVFSFPCCIILGLIGNQLQALVLITRDVTFLAGWGLKILICYCALYAYYSPSLVICSNPSRALKSGFCMILSIQVFDFCNACNACNRLEFQELSLAGLDLSAVPSEVWESGEIVKVDLSRNSIQELPSELFSCVSLQVKFLWFRHT